MSDAESGELTQILRAVGSGDEAAKDQLFSFAYDELHDLAARLMRNERENHTLQPTALVNEAGMRFLSNTELNQPESRAFFFGRWRAPCGRCSSITPASETRCGGGAINNESR